MYIQAMKIEQTDKEIVFRMPITSKTEELQDMLEMLKFLEITARSKATNVQIGKLVSDVKKGRWEKTKVERGL